MPHGCCLLKNSEQTDYQKSRRCNKNETTLINQQGEQALQSSTI